MKNKMKKSTKNILIVIIVLTFIASTFSISGLFSIIPVATNTPIEGKYIGVPSYAYLKCSESDNVVSVPPSSFQKFGNVVIKCQQGGDTLIQQCDVTLKQPSCSEVSGISKEEAAMLWSVCTTGSQCSLNAGSSATNVKYLKNAWNCNEAEENKEYSIHLNPNQFILAEFQTGNILQGASLELIGNYRVYFKPFFIYYFNNFDVRTGSSLPNTRDCVYNDAINDINKAIMAVRGGGQLTSQLPIANSIDKIYLRQREARIPFISNIVAVIPQYTLFQENAYEAYCTNKAVYRVEEIETPGGTYRVANTNTNAQIRNVDCCNKGDCNTNEYCDNFNCKPISNGIPCSALNQCPIVGFQPTYDKKVVYQECINSICQTKEKSIACNFASDCPGGYCDIDVLNPSNNKCKYITPQERCGNGVCEDSIAENYQSCPIDCSSNGGEKSNLLWLWVLIGGLFLVMMTYIIRTRKKGRK